MLVPAWVVSTNTNLLPYSLWQNYLCWSYLLENENIPVQRVEQAGWGILRDNPSIPPSLVTTSSGEWKSWHGILSIGWYHLSRKPEGPLYLMMLIVSKPFWAGCGCVSIYYEHVPRSSKYLLWTSLVLTHTRPFDFCQGGLRSTCQRIAVMHISSELWLKMCLGVSCAPWLAGSENMKAFWLSKLISINKGPAVITQFKTHAAVKQAFLNSQGAPEDEPDAIGRYPSRNVAYQPKAGLGDNLALLQ